MSSGHSLKRGADRWMAGFLLVFFLVCLGFEAWVAWLVVALSSFTGPLLAEEATLSAQEDTMAKSS